MKNLQIDEKTAKTLYPSASAEFKAMLHDTFGEKFFQQKITDRVKTYGDACAILGVSSEIIGYDEMTDDEIAYRKLKVIIEALNDGWKPNWDDTNEPKYYPWFYLNKPGFRLFSVDCGYNFSAVGSRLCFQKREVAEYAANQFDHLYMRLFTV